MIASEACQARIAKDQEFIFTKSLKSHCPRFSSLVHKGVSITSTFSRSRHFTDCGPMPNYLEGIRSCLILEAKQGEVWIIIGWETTNELQVLQAIFQRRAMAHQLCVHLAKETI